MNKYVAILALVAVTIIWGLGYPLQKMLNEDHGVQEFFLVGTRFSVGGLFLLVLFFKKLKTITKNELFWSVVLGVLLSFAFVFQTYGLNNTSSANNAFITSLYVVIIPVLMIFFKEKLRSKTVIASIFAIIGCLILAFGGEASGGGNILGDALTLVCAFMYAIHIIVCGVSINDKGCRPIVIGIGQLLVTGFICLLIGFILPSQDNSAYLEQIVTPEVIATFLFLGIANCAYGFTIQIIVQKTLSPSNVGLIVSFESVFAAIFGILILNDAFGMNILVGGLCLVTAVLITELDVNKIFKRKKRIQVV